LCNCADDNKDCSRTSQSRVLPKEIGMTKVTDTAFDKRFKKQHEEHMMAILIEVRVVQFLDVHLLRPPLKQEWKPVGFNQILISLGIMP